MMNDLKRLRIVRSALGLTAAAAVVVSSVGLATAAGAGTVTNTGNANNVIIGSGSSTTYPMMQALDLLYNEAPGCTTVVDFAGATAIQPLDYSCLTQAQATNGHNLNPVIIDPSTGVVSSNPAGISVVNPFNDIVVQEAPVGSSNGILQLENNDAAIVAKYSYDTGTVNVANNVNFARSSRSPAAAVDDKGLNFVAYAKDGVDWAHYSIVNGVSTASDVTVSGGVQQTSYSMLTPGEISGIYSGAITNWKQVGGKNAPIVVFSAQEGSGTQSTWKSYIQANGAAGVDPSKLSNLVNCFNKTGLVFNAVQTVSASQCAGPVDIFENETGSLNINSLPTTLKDPTAVSGFNAPTAALAPVTQVATVATAPTSIAAPAACSTWVWGCKPGLVTKGARVGTSTPAQFTYSQIYTLRSPTANQILGDSVFFYSSGLFNHQCVGSNQAVNTAASCTRGNFVNFAADPTGKATFQEGSLGGSATAGATSYPSIDQTSCPVTTIPSVRNACLPTEAAVLTNSFPSVRYVYNVYSNGSSTAVPAATPATLAYISENGFLCSPRTVNQTNPLDGKTYRDDIDAAILGSGFYPLSGGATTGVVNTTPQDEGTVSHYANSITGVSTSPYNLYVAASGSGGGDPTGFCSVTSTDSNGLAGS